jgi:hypothetical protein
MLDDCRGKSASIQSNGKCGAMASAASFVTHAQHNIDEVKKTTLLVS